MRAPAFQFYPDDFLAGTMHFTDAEVGLYMRLLCVQWAVGGVPNDDDEIASYGKGRTSVARVKSKFVLGEDGMLRNLRLEQERRKQQEYRESRAVNGKHGGRPCKAHGNHMVNSENHMVSQTKAQESSPSPSPSPHIAERERNLPEYPNWEAVKFEAVRIGLAEWKAKDWFEEMEGCGWIDHQKRPIVRWQAVLARVKTKWEADGRPMQPPTKTPHIASGSGGGGLSGNTLAIVRTKELEEINRKISNIAGVDSHVELSDSDRAEVNKLKTRRKEIKNELGWKI